MDSTLHPLFATVREGRIVPDEIPTWPEGTRLKLVPLAPSNRDACLTGHVIIVGFGLAGRYVADLLDQAKIAYTIVEKNEETVETQRALGRRAIAGDCSNPQTLQNAGIATASALVLTVPDESAVLEAVELARRLRADIYIIARTQYASQGMRAVELGADEVIKAEHAVALQFYERLSAILCREMALSGEGTE